jgi:hypothetical protein
MAIPRVFRMAIQRVFRMAIQRVFRIAILMMFRMVFRMVLRRVPLHAVRSMRGLVDCVVDPSSSYHLSA